MADESFEILYTSPISPLNTHYSIPEAEISTTKTIIEPTNVSMKINEVTDSLLKISPSNESQFSSNVPSAVVTNDVNEIVEKLVPDSLNHFEANSVEKPYIDVDNGSSSALNPQKQSVVNNPVSSDDSPAANFIHGEMDFADVLKLSMYSQYPSIPMSECPEDVELQNMMLKDALIHANEIMTQLYNETQESKSNVQAMKVEHRDEIAKLHNEILELRRDLESKVEQITSNEETRRKEHEESARNLSEKSDQIENMTEQAQKLEHEQLALRNENLKLKKDLETKEEEIAFNEEAKHKEHEDFVRSLSEQSAQIENMSAQTQKLEHQQLSLRNENLKLKKDLEFNVKENIFYKKEIQNEREETSRTYYEKLAAEKVANAELKKLEQEKFALHRENWELKNKLASEMEEFTTCIHGHLHYVRNYQSLMD